MSKQSDQAIEAIDRLIFTATQPIVIALTGGWGEGKSYFWTSRVIPRFPKVKTGYISVFGADSLAIIRERIAIASLNIGEDKDDDKADWRKKLDRAAAGLNRVVGFWATKFGLSDSIAVELLHNFSIRSGWIVCIDDVERLSEKVGFDIFLGYVTELRDKWKLKVVLIYNREPIEKNKDNPFHQYHEKVIDRVIPFSLDLADVVDLVFKDLSLAPIDAKQHVIDWCDVLKLRNIRILAKARSYFEETRIVLGTGASTEFQRTVLGSILLFTYTKFSHQKPASLTFERLSEYSEWTERMRGATNTARNVADAPEHADDAAQTLLENYGYRTTDDLDLVLLMFVQSDVIDAPKLRDLHAKFIQNTEMDALRIAVRRMWESLYHSTFRDNSEELCNTIEEVLPPYIPHISLGELSFTLAVLDRLGRGRRAAAYFDQFMSSRGTSITREDIESFAGSEVAYAPLQAHIRQVRDLREKDNRSLNEVLLSTFTESLLTQSDAKRISEFSTEDLFTHLTTHDHDKLTKKLKMLTWSDDPTVREMAQECVQRIAALSDINRLRLEGMGMLRRNDVEQAIPQ